VKYSHGFKMRKKLEMLQWSGVGVSLQSLLVFCVHLQWCCWEEEWRKWLVKSIQVKLSLWAPWRRKCGGGTARFICNFGARWEWAVNVTARLLYPPGKRLRCSNTRLGGAWDRLKDGHSEQKAVLKLRTISDILKWSEVKWSEVKWRSLVECV
jgi:hypothetical protein